MKRARIILGLDPGSVATGWGVIRAEGSRQFHIAAGVVRPKSKAFNERLVEIHDAVLDICSEYAPVEVAIETPFYHQNAQTTIKLAHVRGALVVCCARSGVAVHEYSPMEIKKSLVGRGRAEKDQVAKMVCLILGISEKLPADATDALAAAVTHAQLGPLSKQSAASRKRRGPSLARGGKAR